MHTRVLHLKHGPTLLVRPLRHGDVRTVVAVFERLGDASRRRRFNGPKPCLSRADLRALAAEDGSHHVLVGWAEGDPQPVAIARLVRDGKTAEIAFAVADDYQHQGIGSALVRELLADARAAGITEIVAQTTSDNPAALALMRRAAEVLELCMEGPELSVRAAIA
jgi:ribosomal protein S18 acetylase RimI-like enzyme